MAYLIVPNYKDQAILCQEPCNHTDCRIMRLDWLENGNCRICGKKLEPGQAFIYLQQGTYAKEHWLCPDDTTEKPGIANIRKGTL